MSKQRLLYYEEVAKKKRLEEKRQNHDPIDHNIREFLANSFAAFAGDYDLTQSVDPREVALDVAANTTLVLAQASYRSKTAPPPLLKPKVQSSTRAPRKGPVVEEVDSSAMAVEAACRMDCIEDFSNDPMYRGVLRSFTASSGPQHIFELLYEAEEGAGGGCGNRGGGSEDNGDKIGYIPARAQSAAQVGSLDLSRPSTLTVDTSFTSHTADDDSSLGCQSSVVDPRSPREFRFVSGPPGKPTGTEAHSAGGHWMRKPLHQERYRMPSRPMVPGAFPGLAVGLPQKSTEELVAPVRPQSVPVGEWDPRVPRLPSGRPIRTLPSRSMTPSSAEFLCHTRHQHLSARHQHLSGGFTFTSPEMHPPRQRSPVPGTHAHHTPADHAHHTHTDHDHALTTGHTHNPPKVDQADHAKEDPTGAPTCIFLSVAASTADQEHPVSPGGCEEDACSEKVHPNGGASRADTPNDPSENAGEVPSGGSTHAHSSSEDLSRAAGVLEEGVGVVVDTPGVADDDGASPPADPSSQTPLSSPTFQTPGSTRENPVRRPVNYHAPWKPRTLSHAGPEDRRSPSPTRGIFARIPTSPEEATDLCAPGPADPRHRQPHAAHLTLPGSPQQSCISVAAASSSLSLGTTSAEDVQAVHAVRSHGSVSGSSSLSGLVGQSKSVGLVGQSKSVSGRIGNSGSRNNRRRASNHSEAVGRDSSVGSASGGVEGSWKGVGTRHGGVGDEETTFVVKMPMTGGVGSHQRDVCIFSYQKCAEDSITASISGSRRAPTWRVKEPFVRPHTSEALVQYQQRWRGSRSVSPASAVPRGSSPEGDRHRGRQSRSRSRSR
eukprot:Rmarinus@m.14435